MLVISWSGREALYAEFMSCGSVYDYIHKQKAVLKLPMLLRVAIDISKGMDYLHQNNIIHRDLKAANLLMDENEVEWQYFQNIKKDQPVMGVTLLQFAGGPKLREKNWVTGCR